MAIATMNTVVPAASGTSEYEKNLRSAYGIQDNTGKGMNYKSPWTGSHGGLGANSGSTGLGSSTNGYINQMYDSSLESQKQQLQSNYETDVSNLDAEKETARRENEQDLERTYVEAYKKAKNFNEVQNAHGLTSGAMGQAALASGNQMQADMTNLRAAQEQIDAEIERQRSILGKEYAAAIAKAQADNDFQRAQALYEQAKLEEQRMIERQQAAAQLMASVGDYTLTAQLLGLSPSQLQKLEEAYGGAAESSGGAGGGSDRTDWANLSNADRKEYLASGGTPPEGAYTKGWV